MVNSISYKFAIVFFTLYWLNSFSLATGNNEIRMTIVSGRPLRAARRALEGQFGCVIAYEDPEYAHPAMLQTVYEGFDLPKSYEISFSFRENEAIAQIMNRMIAQYKQINTTVVYVAKSSNTSRGILNVFPAQNYDNSGNLSHAKSPLNAEISTIQNDLKLGEAATYMDVLNLICTRISRSSGKTITPSGRAIMYRLHVETDELIKARDKTAREWLNLLVAQYNSTSDNKWSWNYGSDPSGYCSVEISPMVSGISLYPGIHWMSLEAARPLKLAAVILAREYNTIVNYEDPEYQCPCDIFYKDGEPVELSGGTFEYLYHEADGVEAVLLDVVKEYYRGGEFCVRKTSRGFHIFPFRIRDAEDRMMPWKPILATDISFPQGRRSARENLDLLCDHLTSLTGRDIKVGELPDLSGRQLFMNLDPNDNRSAADWLDTMAQMMGENIGWHFLYTPKNRGFVINFAPQYALDTPE